MRPERKGYVSVCGPYFDSLWAQWSASPEAQALGSERLAQVMAAQQESRRKPGGKYRR